ncbi:E3 ubiquitin/ISG15 ligase TRIM25-like [Bombina bombina]|uniref:E3 ubiquitin/ISG15 ligase TRIM25-like n=1 Tax=Bombina bombina TaxID=8345 RepID=UPI00235AF1A7|nr:E3 ubiquitin/ISG15 ligase TRIM25-like [Bombina bombina]
MASADLSEELNCSICLSIYTAPVILRCGHNFCRACIAKVLDSQEQSGVYTCPECREQFKKRPGLQRNWKLHSIVEHVQQFKERPVPQRNMQLDSTAKHLQTSHLKPDQHGILCTYCIHSPVLAAKSCLMCEASLCDDHLRVHSKSDEHVLTAPTTSFNNRKCPVHNKFLEYYCSEDNTCICVSCSLAGEHRGHQVEMLTEASEKKKNKLRNVLETLTLKREQSEIKVQNLQKDRKSLDEKSADITERVTSMFKDMREQLEVLEKQVLSEISRQKEQALCPIADLIQNLKKEKDELTRKINHIEEVCSVTDPLTVLQEQEYDNFSDAETKNYEDTQTDIKTAPAGGDLDEDLISVTLHRRLADIVTGVKVKKGFHLQEAPDLFLNVNTAANYIELSSDLKTASYPIVEIQRPVSSERFEFWQVLSTRSFASGQHYWEVETCEAKDCIIGMSYSSIERKGKQSIIGKNSKSWCVQWCDPKTYHYRIATKYNKRFSAAHDSVEIPLKPIFSCQRFAIFLDYEAGRLSFYELGDPIRCLHTFTASFTEPLHAAFWVNPKWSL